MEVLRRLLLCLFTIAAVTTWFAPAEKLYLIEKVDFKNELAHHPFPWKHKGKSVAQYTEEVTRGRIQLIAPEQWRDIAAKASGSQLFFVKSNDPIIKKFIPCFSRQVSVLYLRQNQGNAFMSIRQLSSDDYTYKKAPGKYRTPYFLWSPFLFLIGILFYGFLSRHQFSDDTLHYGVGFSAVIGPDMLGLFFISFFYILGLVVGLPGSSGGIISLFSSPLILITCILWSFSLFGVYMMKTGAGYAGLGLHCSDKQVVRFSPAGTQVIPHSDIAMVKPGYWKPSKWVTRLGFFISLLNWRALGPTLLGANRRDPLLEIHLTDGRVWRYYLTGAQNVKAVLSCLQRNGVKLDPKLMKISSQ